MGILLEGQEVLRNATPHTLVYLATHDGADKRLPHRYRSFISFSYGGRWIEDFNLISTLKSDRMERSIYGAFNDNISSYDVIDGQYYWGSHFTKNTLSLLLSTDEMTEQLLQDFKSWFTPGAGKELILAEYPNRAINARVSKTPDYHMLPFEQKITLKFANRTYEISTTVYRGEIDLEFTMDDPFWYSIYNVLPSYGQDGAEDWFKTLGINPTDNPTSNSLMANKDYLKVILEDGVPTKEMFASNDILTGDITHNIVNKLIVGGSKIVEEENSEDTYTEIYYEENHLPKKKIVKDGLQDLVEILSGVSIAKPGRRLSSSSLELINNGNNASAYLYYTGSAPAPTILKFSLTPTIERGYIKEPYNKVYNEVATRTGAEHPLTDYNKIVVGTEEFRFTTPSLYTGYNLAMNIITSESIKVGTSTIDLHILLNEGVNEYYSRSWALGILNYLKAFEVGIDLETSLITDKETFAEEFAAMMERFLYIQIGGTYEEPVYSIMPAAFEFNSKNGVSTGTFKVRKFTLEGLDKWDLLSRFKGTWHINIKLKNNWLVDPPDNIVDQSVPDEVGINAAAPNITQMLAVPTGDWRWLLFNAGFDMLDAEGNYLFSVKPFMDYTEEYQVTENVGDMVYSKYLYLTEKNLYDENGMIDSTLKGTCTPIKTDYPQPLSNFDILYKHMYL